MGEALLLHGDLTGEILGAAFEVHRVLGVGFLEAVYEEALCRELKARHLGIQRQVKVPVYYKNELVGTHIPDLIVEEKVIAELEAVRELAEIHSKIAIAYLAATHLRVAVLLNFGTPSLQHKRLIR